MDKKIRAALRAYSKNQNDDEAAHRVAKELLRSQFTNLPIENVLEANLHHIPQVEILEWEAAVSEEMDWESIEWFWNTDECPTYPAMDNYGYELDTPALPTLIALCTFAKSHGCKYIKFLENGPVLDGWPIYNEEAPPVANEGENEGENDQEDENLDNLLDGHIYE